MVATVGDAISEGFASKADIAEVRTELKADLARLETRIETSAKRNLLAMIAVGGLIVAAVKLL